MSERKMNAVLVTNSELNSLQLRDIRLFGDDSAGVCSLDLQSSPFQARIGSFYFDSPSFPDFVCQLQRLSQSLTGKARLDNSFEEPFIQFEGDGLGHILVSGKLVDTTYGRMQQFAFEFQTDQTALSPFICDLQAVGADSR